jgi:hypothetical protein
MPNWSKLVREKLVRKKFEDGGLPPAYSDEVIRELAAHLEETYEAARSQSLPDVDAVQLALQEIGDWHALAEQIRCAKSKGDHMNYRTKSLWLPALASLLGASLAMSFLQRIGVRPRLVWNGPVEMALYWPWLAILPFFGAFGAFLSRCAGGAVRIRVTAALAPVLWLLLVCILTEPLELAARGLSHLLYFGYGVAEWVAIPGLALLIGAAPFLHESPAPETRRSTT